MANLILLLSSLISFFPIHISVTHTHTLLPEGSRAVVEGTLELGVVEVDPLVLLQPGRVNKVSTATKASRLVGNCTN